MSGTAWTAARVLAERTPGMRMRILFDTANAEQHGNAMAPEAYCIAIRERQPAPENA